MTSSNPISTAAASGGVAGAAVVILSWALSLVHVEVPAEVAASLMVVVSPILHLVALKLGVDPAPDAPVVTVIADPVKAAPAPVASTVAVVAQVPAPIPVAIPVAIVPAPAPVAAVPPAVGV